PLHHHAALRSWRPLAHRTRRYLPLSRGSTGPSGRVTVLMSEGLARPCHALTRRPRIRRTEGVARGPHKGASPTWRAHFGTILAGPSPWIARPSTRLRDNFASRS